jgi:hypothetical protein
MRVLSMLSNCFVVGVTNGVILRVLPGRGVHGLVSDEGLQPGASRHSCTGEAPGQTLRSHLATRGPSQREGRE